jgi:hypothetical protein
MAFVPYFAVLYSLKCRSLPAFGPKNGPGPTQIWLDPTGARHTTIARAEIRYQNVYLAFKRSLHRDPSGSTCRKCGASTL